MPDRHAFDGPTGSTPLSDDDIQGLIPTWVMDRDDLNKAEAENIGHAVDWVRTRRGGWNPETLLAEPMMRELHERMFGDVWHWAGSYRGVGTNIGVPPERIVSDLVVLLEDVACQIDSADTPWPTVEVAVRFHHRLVSVHPFPNGNGRHARLATDILLIALDEPPFTWGAGQDLASQGGARTAYLEALRIADREFDYDPLHIFATS